MIHIIDCNLGNIGSVVNMLLHLDAKIQIASCGKDIRHAEKIILPGVGAFDTGMQSLYEHGFIDEIKDAVLERNTKLLGICLGMQLLMESSQEGKMPGLGLIAGEVKKFKFLDTKIKIPHMGWNTIKIEKNNSLIEPDPNFENRFYFVHSYHVECSDSSDIASSTFYGVQFTSFIEKNNIMGVQFHPEKSHRYGKQLFKNFMES